MTSCVSARSGALKITKNSASVYPTTPSEIMAVSRDLANTVAIVALTITRDSTISYKPISAIPFAVMEKPPFMTNAAPMRMINAAKIYSR